MFNLEQAINEWRAQMLAAGIKAPVPLDELEAHLREEFAHLASAGTDAQTAFENAARNVGQANLLKNEFKKVQDFRNRRARRNVTIFAGATLSVVSFFLISAIISGWGNFVEMNFDQKLTGLAAVIAAILFAASGYFGRAFFPQISSRKARRAICICGGTSLALWWEYFFYVIIPRHEYEFMMSQLLVALLWGFVAPCGAFFGLLAAVEKPKLGFAGISNHYASMNNPNPPPESGRSTYFRSLVFLLPAIVLWMLGMINVFPQLHAIWFQSGAGTSQGPVFVNTLFALMSLFKDNFVYIFGLIIASLSLLEWRFKRWPRYRRAIVGTGVFVLNLAVLFSFFILFIVATIAAQHLLIHIK